jgi:hypothetical protein
MTGGEEKEEVEEIIKCFKVPNNLSLAVFVPSILFAVGRLKSSGGL